MTEQTSNLKRHMVVSVLMIWLCSYTADAFALEPVDVEGQPLAANAKRVVDALEFLGSPLTDDLIQKLGQVSRERDASAIQKLLDPLVVFEVSPVLVFVRS